jgi:hypothetical protein
MGLKAEEYRRKAEEADSLARKTLDLHASDTYHSVASCYREQRSGSEGAASC